MPIHDQGYRRYRGGKAGGRAWLVIMKTGIRTMLGDKKFIALLAAAWIQFLVRAVQFYIAANFSQAAVIAPKAETFRDFFDKQDIFVYILTVTLGSRLIAQDRRVNALQIYLAKPLTRAEYIFGKFGILASFLLFVTWVPAILLLGVQVVFAGNFEFLKANAYLFPAITLYAAIEVAMTSTAMLALSSLSTNSRFVGIMYTGLIFFSLALYNVLRFITGSTRLSWVAFGNNLTQLGDVIFRVPLHFQTPWPVSLLMVAALIAVSALVLERRVRGVEIIA
jgi:ABC-type transport system involved in multi-copper enzyme maturation permease subunit